MLSGKRLDRLLVAMSLALENSRSTEAEDAGHDKKS